VPLFLDNLPLHSWIDATPSRTVQRWSVLLPALLTPADWARFPKPEGAKPTRWKFDTACAFDAYCWRHHLRQAGLRPDIHLGDSADVAWSAFGHREELPVRTAALWLFSNIPALRDKPFRLALDPGITFIDRACPEPQQFRPLIGLGAFVRGGVTIKVDPKRRTVSLWTPGTRWEGARLFLRRLRSGFATADPFRQADV
jgi:hypothetical protein